MMMLRQAISKIAASTRAGAVVVGASLALLLTAMPASTLLRAAGKDADPAHENGGSPLPTDPEILSGSLPNGLRYVIKPHRGTPGKVALRLIVRAGSLSESEEARGAAAIAARLLEAASAENQALRTGAGPEGAQDILDSFVADFEATRFTAGVAGDDAGAIKGALWRLADIARGAGLSEERVTALRPGALAGEEACGLNVRLMRAVAPSLLPGSRLAEHLPCPTDEHVCALGAKEIVEFVRTRYTPQRMTVVVVGDAPPEMIRNYVTRFFADLAAAGPGGAAMPVEAIGVAGEGVGPRVIVASDAELPTLVVELMVVAQAMEPTKTVADLRRRVVDSLAMRTLQQRLRGVIDRGEGQLRSAEVWTGAAPGPMRMTTATVTGDALQMKRVVERLCREVAHARYEGVTDHQLAGARAEILAEMQEAALSEDGSDVTAAMEKMSRVVEHGSALMSPRQGLALVERAMETISAGEVSESLSACFDLDRSVVVVLTPGEGGASVGEGLRPLVEESLASLPNAAAQEDRAAALLAWAPRIERSGGVSEITLDPESGVTSLWLNNGVRGHHREMRDRPGRVVIAVTIAGGRIEEEESQRGLTLATAALWRNPASASRSAAQIRRIMLGQPVKLAASISEDGVRLTALCARENAEPAMQLLHLLLTEPVVEAPAFARWRWGILRDIERAGGGGLREALAAALYAGEESRRPTLEGDEVRALQRSSVQQWVTALVRRAPLECAIVGDIARSDAMDLMARYLGTVPPRDRGGEGTFCELRRVAARPIPGVYRLTAASEGREALTLVALRGAETGERRARVPLDLAAIILALRLQRDSGAGGVGGAVGVVAQHIAGEAGPGEGIFYAMGSSGVEEAEGLAGVMNREMSDLAQAGPSEEELAQAKAGLQAEWNFRMSDPSYWAGRLSDMTLHGGSVEEIVSRGAEIEAASRAEVASALSEHDAPRGREGDRLTIIVTPRPPGRPLDNLAATRGR